MKKKLISCFSVLLVFVMLFSVTEPFVLNADAAEYPAIPALKIARVYQPKSDNWRCYWASVATVQGYCLGEYTYGGVTTSYRIGGKNYNIVSKTDAISKKLEEYTDYDANYAGNLSTYPVPMTIVRSGLGNNTATYEKIYNQLKQGKPVVIYGKSVTNGNHASVVIAYNGSSSKLEPSGFTVMEVKHWSDSLWWNSTNVYNRYANNPQEKKGSGESCYVTLSSWLSYEDRTLIQIVYPTNPVAISDNNYSVNTDSNYTSVYTTGISDADATIYTYLKGATAVKGCGFYIGTDENDLTKVTKSLSGASDGAGTVEYIYYKMSKWYGTLEPGTKYYYRFWYTDSNGKEVKSPVNWFLTTGTAAKTVASVGIKKLPDKTEYHPLDYVDLTGMVLTVTYSDGSSEDITDGFTHTPDKITMGGIWDITVTHEEVSTSFQIDAGSDSYLEQFYQSPDISYSTEIFIVGDTICFSWQDCFADTPEAYKENSGEYGYEVTYTVNGEEHTYCPAENTFSYTFDEVGTYMFTVSSFLGMSSQDSCTVTVDVADGLYFSIDRMTLESDVFTVYWYEFCEDASYEVIITYDNAIVAEDIVENTLEYSFDWIDDGVYTAIITAISPDGERATDEYSYFAYDDGPETDDGEYEIKVSDIVARAGESIDVPIEITYNPGIAGLRLFVSYPEELELVGVEDNGLFSGSVSSSNKYESPFVISWFSSSGEDEYAIGEYVTLKFNIKEETADGDYYIQITQKEGDAVTSSGKAYNFITGDGCVTVTSRLSGDVNGDDGVNMMDIVLLQQYLNNWDVAISESNADVTGDGNINMMDIVLLQQYLNNWDVTLK